MGRIAFISEGNFVSFTGIVLTMAALTAICFFLAFYLNKSGNFAAGFGVIPLSLVLSLVLSRFLHWFWRPDTYQGFLSAMTDLSTGGFYLLGAFLGCFLAAAAFRALGLCRNLPEMLDCMSIAGAGGICVGRLASFFDSSARGQILENLPFLPFSYPVTNVVSGATEYRFAVFIFQSLAALVIFLCLTRFYLTRRETLRDGDTCLIFLICYGASQVVLDSTRYDSLFFRFNGFVSIEQILGAVILAAGAVFFSVRLVRQQGFRFWYPGLWLVIAAAMGGAGYMEYYVQRHGSAALFAYSVMSLCLAVTVGTILFIRALAGKIHEEKANFVG